MSAAVSTSLMTLEEFLRLPHDDRLDRELICGELRERPMTYRNRWHSHIEATIAYILNAWLRTLPRPRGKVYSGEVGCILRRDPDTIVGIDVAYMAAQAEVLNVDGTSLLVGAPLLAVEILSPSDRFDDINEKVDGYLAAGVPLVWVVDPHFRTVRVHRPDAEPVLFNVEHELSGDPDLPGFRCAVAEIFEDLDD
jgi:Uma2 family endonuclease